MATFLPEDPSGTRAISQMLPFSRVSLALVDHQLGPVILNAFCRQL